MSEIIPRNHVIGVGFDPGTPTQTVTLIVTEGERVSRFEQTREIHWPGRQGEDITTLVREVADYAIEQITAVKAVPIEEPDEENPTGGIVPPFITDRIPGHEGDQP